MNSVKLMVGPQYIEKNKLLATIDNNNNAIIICQSESGERAYVVQGAGAGPSASAMFDDLIKIIQKYHR